MKLRQLGKRIPGNPAVIVENMTGAGSLISANHVYKVAKLNEGRTGCKITNMLTS